MATGSWIYFTFLQQQVPRMQGRIPEAAQNPLKVPTLDSYTGSKGRGGKGREDGRGSGCVYKEICAKGKKGGRLEKELVDLVDRTNLTTLPAAYLAPIFYLGFVFLIWELPRKATSHNQYWSSLS